MLAALPIAHAGHWFEGALYLAPVVVLVIVLFVQGRRDDTDEQTAHLSGERDLAIAPRRERPHDSADQRH